MSAINPEGVVRLARTTKIYPGMSVPALNEIELSVGEGEFFSILGPSGSGKTTMLRMIAGFERPTSGRVYLNGQDVTDVEPHLRPVNTVFQSYALFPHMTIAQNIVYPLRMAKVSQSERDARVREVAELTQLSDFLGRFPHQLSGGQRQRVALARATVGRPKVLLLDEPLGALDQRLRQHMRHALVELQHQLGITFVYVTHDQEEALSMSDRVAVVAQGVIQQLATPSEIYFTPANRFIAQFIGKSNLFEIDVRRDGGGFKSRLGGVEFPFEADKEGTGRLSLRFECIEVVRQEANTDKPVKVPGRVTDQLFLGQTLELRVKCGRRNFIATIPSSQRGQYRPGDDVFLAFDPSEGMYFHG